MSEQLSENQNASEQSSDVKPIVSRSLRPIEKTGEHLILRFGEGRILIAPCEGESGLFVGIGEYKNQQWPIDVVIEEVKGSIWTEWAVALYFDKPESIDSMIHVLNDFKKMRFGPQ